MVRIWNLRINLDEFNSVLGGVFTDQDRALVLLGLGLGFNGGMCSNSVPSSFRSGWEVGYEARKEAESFQQKKSNAGHTSVEERKKKYGTAQPRTQLEHNSNTVQTLPEPIPNPQSLNPKTNNPQSDPSPSAQNMVKEKKPSKPKNRNFAIAALEMSEADETQAMRVWEAWPKTGWNFTTKSESPRRINKALFLERYSQILQHCPIRKSDDSRITSEDLSNAAIAFAVGRIKEGRANGSEIPNVPCIANFFSSCENEKNPWKDAVLAYFGG